MIDASATRSPSTPCTRPLIDHRQRVGRRPHLARPADVIGGRHLARHPGVERRIRGEHRLGRGEPSAQQSAEGGVCRRARRTGRSASRSRCRSTDSAQIAEVDRRLDAPDPPTASRSSPLTGREVEHRLQRDADRRQAVAAAIDARRWRTRPSGSACRCAAASRATCSGAPPGSAAGPGPSRSQDAAAQVAYTCG